MNALPNTVYVVDDGGCMYGIDRVTAQTWYFTLRKNAPVTAYVGYGLAKADRAKLAAIPKPFIGSYNDLCAALRPDTRQQEAAQATLRG